MKAVGVGADTVCPAPCFDAYAAVLAVQDPPLPFLLGDFCFNFGDCCSDVTHDETPYLVFDLLYQSFLNSVRVFNLLGQSVLCTSFWSLVYHFLWTLGRHGLFSEYMISIAPAVDFKIKNIQLT